MILRREKMKGLARFMISKTKGKSEISFSKGRIPSVPQKSS